MTNEVCQSLQNSSLNIILKIITIKLTIRMLISNELSFLGSLNDDQIRMLTAKQLAFVPPKTIQALPKERVAVSRLSTML